MIGLALSGGGSRAMAFHLGCLRALNDLGLLEQVGVLSTISGGSLIGAYYAYTPDKTFSEFDAEICRFLRQGFHKSIAIELAKPRNLLRCGTSLAASKIAVVCSRIFGGEPAIRRYPSRSDMFHRVLQREMFNGLKMSSRRRQNMEVVIGACELRKGSAFRFGNAKSGDWRHGEMVDWDVEVGFAAAASAAYPIFLPAFDRIWKFLKRGKETEHRVLITDGGVYDNLGLQVLEPGRDSKVSLHTFPCEYLIACNAGQGQEAGMSVPLGLFSRVARSFEVVHRRVQDSTMHRLHQMKNAGQIKGFAMPYLGQQDNSLPFNSPDVVPREDVIEYPTNFAGMSDAWIEKLSKRGEQLTRGLVEHYLSTLL
jgi:NTE family protein